MWIKWKHNTFALDHFVFKECGGGGESQLLSILEAFKPTYTTTDALRIKMKDALFDLPQDMITQQLDHYKSAFHKGTLHGIWDPTEMTTAGELGQQVLKPIETRNPYDFEEDEFTMFLLARAFHVNISVLNLTYSVVWKTETSYAKNIILLFYDLPHFKHYQILGLSTGPNVVTLLSDSQMPDLESFLHPLLSHSPYSLDVPKPAPLRRDIYATSLILQIARLIEKCPKCCS